ncbi:sugar ABC transporter ATP-binding protein [Microbacterium dextranolyticum]|uniref:Sugar ABC transporter ATP-binding protein n=1 Tax=Microbacterium dextranolyticum TaxID=36806 RepID=A0A9W6HNR7_9MICO|nr:sugar ABC transporter ATP-binding protein [Microbacterium dextranolyticum]MBM7464049.1 simple sugar transport system ATP-binding protein [Microbacterium dextranolyticum]GLJ96621.1 sugar ABC transporter ATP-binding protein [Microbacterium dextranolyticum]
MANEPLPIVEVRGASITFPGVKALDEVNFRLLPGEVHTLMGENGAGKSTLIKALTGVYQIDSGSILVFGTERRFSGTASAQAAGISTVYQEVNLCTNLTIGENVMLGHETRGLVGINWRKTHARAHEVLADMGLGDLDTRAPLSSISIALQQLVAISRAMVTKSKVLILDEPTSSLDAAEVEMLFGVIRRLRDQGVAILFVSHFLDQVYAISDRITVLRNGGFVGEYLKRDLDRTELISKMIGKDINALRALGSNRQVDERDRTQTPVYAADELGRKGSLTPTDIEIHKGEVVGFAGLLGSGRTELARLIFGADKPDAGTVRLKGKKTTISSPVSGLANHIAYSTENRREDGIVGDLSIRENIMLAVQAQRGWMRRVPARDVDRMVKTYMERFSVRPNDPDRPIRLLSGGNQQKVLLGRWLATDPELLLLDEPTRGIDVGAKADIQETVAELAEGGMSVVFISSELEEVVRLSERILIMKDHQKVGEVVNGPDVTAERIVSIIAADSGEKAEARTDALVDEVEGELE